MVDPPGGVRANNAPANAFLKCVKKLLLDILACSYCKNNQMTPDLYVGDVLRSSESMTMKSVKLWDMSKPKPIAELRNRACFSLWSLFNHSKGFNISISSHYW